MLTVWLRLGEEFGGGIDRVDTFMPDLRRKGDAALTDADASS